MDRSIIGCTLLNLRIRTQMKQFPKTVQLISFEMSCGLRDRPACRLFADTCRDWKFVNVKMWYICLFYSVQHYLDSQLQDLFQMVELRPAACRDQVVLFHYLFLPQITQTPQVIPLLLNNHTIRLIFLPLSHHFILYCRYHL